MGSKAAGGQFKDTWTISDLDVPWINIIEAKYAALHRVLLVTWGHGPLVKPSAFVQPLQLPQGRPEHGISQSQAPNPWLSKSKPKK